MKVRAFRFALLLFVLITALSLFHTKRLAAQNSEPGAANGTTPEVQVYLPLVASQPMTTSEPVYNAIPIAGAAIDRPAAIHGDLNLSLRGYTTTTGTLSLIDVNGPTDADAPQIAGSFSPARLPNFTAVYRVYNWDWSCGDNGCRGELISEPAVTLLEMETSAGEAIAIPSRNPQIYAGGYKAMVLYAEATRITLVYTRDDTPAYGYVVHFEGIAVEPVLLTLYEKLNQEGRGHLPALRNGERIGNAIDNRVKIAVRDTGSFLDPRARKDWWMGY